MKPLITEDERQRLLAHGQARADGQAGDPLPEVRAFLEDLLLQALAPEPVTLEHPAPPQHDFDDDGEPDATDPAPYGG